MTDLLAQYGLIGALVGVIGALVGILAKQQYQGRWNGEERRAGLRATFDDSALATIADIRTEVKELRAELVKRAVELRDLIQPLVTRIALLEHDVQHLQRHCPLLDERRERP